MASNHVRSPAAGVNQRGVRDHNERLILSMIQRNGPLPGSDLAKRAGVSAQTASVILRSLEKDGLLERRDPVRGKVGKPSIPMALNGNGAYAVGLKIGRRSADLVLTDFLGRARQHMQTTYRYPMPEAILGFLKSGLTMIQDSMVPEESARICGIGIASPYEIWNWHETIGAPEDDIAQWKGIEFADEVAKFSELPVYIENDATAACRAEHVYGQGRVFRDFAYFFVGSFIGGGVVLNHSVFEGAHHNAGAFGSLPVRTAEGEEKQLIDTASLYLLEAELSDAGIEPSRIWAQPQDWSDFPEILEAWIDRTGRQLARAALTVCAVIDFEAIVVDGGFPPEVRKRLVERINDYVAQMDQRGLRLPAVEAGTVGRNARALGAASAPIFDQFFLNTHGSGLTCNA